MSHTHTPLMRIAMLEQQRDELLAALKNLMVWQVKNVHCWHNSAFDNASRVITSIESPTKEQPE